MLDEGNEKNMWVSSAEFLRSMENMEKYGIQFYSFPGLDKYGEKKGSMEKYLCFQTIAPLFFPKL